MLQCFTSTSKQREKGRNIISTSAVFKVSCTEGLITWNHSILFFIQNGLKLLFTTIIINIVSLFVVIDIYASNIVYWQVCKKNNKINFVWNSI